MVQEPKRKLTPQELVAAYYQAHPDKAPVEYASEKKTVEQLDDAEKKIVDAYDKAFPATFKMQGSPPKAQLTIAPEGKISWRMWGGWLFGGFSLAFLVTLIVLGVK